MALLITWDVTDIEEWEVMDIKIRHIKASIHVEERPSCFIRFHARPCSRYPGPSIIGIVKSFAIFHPITNIVA